MNYSFTSPVTGISKFLGIAVLFSILVFTGYAFGQANYVVISEVAPMGGASSTFNTGEYIELYNPLASDVTFGANVVITSGEAAGSNAAAWTQSLAGKTIKAYGFLLIGDGGVTTTPDILFPASKNLANSGARSYVQLKNGSTVIDAFGWDPASVSSPNCETASFQPSNTTSNKKSFERKSGPAATANDALGNAWDSNNNLNDFFENTSSTANPQNSSSPAEINPYNTSAATGEGTVSVLPSMWKYDAQTELTFVIKSGSDSSIKGIKIVKPELFSWNTNGISIQPNNAMVSQSGDTTIVENLTLTGSDSIIISIPNAVCADSTDEFSIYVLTSSDGISYGQVKTLPKTLVYGLPRTAAQIKLKDKNGSYLYQSKWVVTKVVVTAANEFGGPSYLQDNTAGLAIYDSAVSNKVERGDEITVLGKVAPYSGLFELTPASILEHNGEGIYFDTTIVTIPQINNQVQNGEEIYEARLIRINNVEQVLTTNNAPAATWAVSGSGTNYNLVSGSNTVQVRISPKSSIANLAVPSGKFDIIGVLGQFNTFYQIMPRSYEDVIEEGAGPRIISRKPYESDMNSNSITFNFTTDAPGSTIIYYGKSSNYGNVVSDSNKVTTHTISISGLGPATVYHVKIGTSSNGDTSFTPDYIAETSSQSSTGTMDVFFNHSVDVSVSAGEDAQVVDISQKLLDRINSSQYSIDLALYSLSGSVGSKIANALIAAKNRGVKIRVIGESDNNGTAPWSTIKNAGIPEIFDNYDAVNDGAGLMHNKFGIFDNRFDSTDTNEWVWSGSWNATDPGNNNDAQNAIEIQDQALANAYTIEFNEMWGSDTDTPNASNSRFGARKLDNTPHKFNIAGTPVELYFDPSDNTTMHIGNALNNAASSINIAMLTFTRSDLAQILVNKKEAGEKVHVLVDNKTDTGNQFSFLQTNGVDILLKGSDVTGYLHHKYAVIDADRRTADQVVITGSHNWSSSAENSNNENTLIIHSKRIANLYFQEFKARYINAGGKDIIAGVEKETKSGIPSDFDLNQNYPNPFNPTTTITFSIPKESYVTLKIFNILGQEVKTLMSGEVRPGNYIVNFNASRLSSGIYFYGLKAGNFYSVKKMILMK